MNARVETIETYERTPTYDPDQLAWLSDPELKRRTVRRMREHAEADRLIRRSYVTKVDDERRWTGCFHGCLVVEDVARERGAADVVNLVLHRVIDDIVVDWHAETEERYGIPRDLGCMLDLIYEASERPPGELAVKLLEAVPVGADLTGVVRSVARRALNPTRNLLPIIDDEFTEGYGEYHELVQMIAVGTDAQVVDSLDYYMVLMCEPDGSYWSELLPDVLEVLAGAPTRVSAPASSGQVGTNGG